MRFRKQGKILELRKLCKLAEKANYRLPFLLLGFPRKIYAYCYARYSKA